MDQVLAAVRVKEQVLAAVRVRVRDRVQMAARVRDWVMAEARAVIKEALMAPVDFASALSVVKKFHTVEG